MNAAEFVNPELVEFVHHPMFPVLVIVLVLLIIRTLVKGIRR